MFDLTTLDVAAVPLAAGYAIGRIGCQLAGDGDYGKPWNGPWAMAYPHGTVPTTEQVHPTPVYETLTMGLVAWLLWRRRHRCAPGGLFALYLVLAGTERFLVEFLRRNDTWSGAHARPAHRTVGGIAAGAVMLAVLHRRGRRARAGVAPASCSAP